MAAALQFPLKNGYPGSKACFITVVSVLTDMAQLRALDQQRPIDPVLFRETQRTNSIDSVVPGCNLSYKGASSAHASLRGSLHDILADVRLDDGGETLLSTYEALLAHKPGKDCRGSNARMRIVRLAAGIPVRWENTSANVL